MAFCEKDKVTWEAAPAAQFHRGLSSDQKLRGACRGKRFIRREHVPDSFGELASDVDPGDLRATLAAQAPLGPFVPLAIVGIPGSMGGGLDERPAQVLRTVLGERPADVTVARLPDEWAQPGVPGELLGAREAADLADLRGDRVGEDRTDPWERAEERDGGMVGAEPSEVRLAGVDLRTQHVDHPQACRRRARPGLGQGEPSEQFATPSPEQIREGDRMAKRHERRVDPVLQRGPMVDEVKPEAGPLALGPDRWVREPDHRYERKPRELGQNPGVDPIGLGGQWSDALDLGCVGDRDIPAVSLERVMDEACPGHRLDRAVHLVTEAQDVGSQPPQPRGIRTDGRHLDGPAVLVQDVHIEPLARQVQSRVQHHSGLPVLVASTTHRLSPARPLFMTFHGVEWRTVHRRTATLSTQRRPGYSPLASAKQPALRLPELLVREGALLAEGGEPFDPCLLYTSPSP